MSRQALMEAPWSKDQRWIYFQCPACKKFLKVRPTLMGVAGPCLFCKVTVQSPQIARAGPLARPHLQGRL